MRLGFTNEDNELVNIFWNSKDNLIGRRTTVSGAGRSYFEIDNKKIPIYAGLMKQFLTEQKH